MTAHVVLPCRGRPVGVRVPVYATARGLSPFERALNSDLKQCLATCVALPLQFPLLIRFGSADHPDFRRHALKAMFFVHGEPSNPPAILLAHITPYLQVRFLESIPAAASLASCSRHARVTLRAICMCARKLSKRSVLLPWAVAVAASVVLALLS